MNSSSLTSARTEELPSTPDPAAILGAAVSLWQTFNNAARRKRHVNLSECYRGGDQYMREVMRVARLFEEWAAHHISFEENDDVWPYLLEDKFGPACLEIIGVSGLVEFSCNDCLRVALRLQLPVQHDGCLPVPVLEEIDNPIPNAAFRTLRIQTVRDHRRSCNITPFTQDDEPFDREYTKPYFAFYGVFGSGEIEHIADRNTYVGAVDLARQLIPGLAFTSCPTSLRKPSARRL